MRTSAGIPRMALAAALLAWFPAASAEPPALDALLRKPQYGLMLLSPAGDHIASTVPLDDRTALAVIRLSDMAVTTNVNPGEDGFIDDAIWVGDRRLLAEWSKRVSGHSQPFSGYSLYATDVDGSNRRHFYGSIVNPLPADPEHVQIAVCVKSFSDGCETRIERVRIDGKGKDVKVVDGPERDARFMTDRMGNPQFSWAYDDDDVQRLYRYRDGAWQLINDEALSGVEWLPIGLTYAGDAGLLWSERKQGPDVIERLDLASGERRVVASDPVFDPVATVRSFDGSEPIGAAFGTGAPVVRYFDDAHPHVALSKELAASFPGEFARVTSSSRDGSRAVVAVTSDIEPGRYYLLDTRSGDIRLLARSRPWLDPATLSPATPFEITASDGTPLSGYLTLPRHADGRPAPLVVLPHGGPYWVRDQWFFDEETQILAAHGYAVLRVNFRGSGGRGRAYVESGYREWGAKMQDDLTDATRWAASQAGVDGSRICAWGASYGGYAALMGAVREPALYRCVVGMAGPYDLPTMYRWGDTQRSDWGEAYLERVLGTDMKVLLERSPTRHAGEIRAGILLVQGGRDRRVTPQHLREMRAALDKANVHYETYLPHNEAHGFFADESRKEYYMRVLDFLDRHLSK
ncbi:alpha/beta hydrolase family protein [Marilutibacter chinensis]|uniref:Prolyl oligopeptidase family serine peptidase n=1 Tax=Marilutibacter chinensis TaxID=2912247 RepID=A0ABS9HS07_9GAMM|nr:alpha/beta fold hydrolase [Lysobacter chinensis]MCF7221716.1 prolyl oligopeptidase family serine peptidase [Lysobacter chinensis]